MQRARSLLAVSAATLALALAGTGATYGVFALTATTDTALRERSAPSLAAAAPTVAGTEATRPAAAPAQTPVDASAPAPTGTPRAAVLAPGDTGRLVRELQGRLSELSWFTPPMTGRYDAMTARGVRAFQGKHGLPGTGTVDPATWRRLVQMTRVPSPDELYNRAGPALLKHGDDGRAVRELQARLRQVAWLFGAVSSHYGDQTVTAVRGFQAKRHLPVTGEVDRRTLDLLDAMSHEPTADELANRKPDPAGGAPLDPRCTTGRALCIDKTTSSLRWVVGGTIKSSLDVRFGAAYTPTREGLFHVFWKDRNHVSTLYGSAMPLSMFFSGGEAIHYSSDFAARGYAGASHGCVNVRDYTALSSLFDQVVTGDKVVIYRS